MHAMFAIISMNTHSKYMVYDLNCAKPYYVYKYSNPCSMIDKVLDAAQLCSSSFAL